MRLGGSMWWEGSMWWDWVNEMVGFNVVARVNVVEVSTGGCGQ